MLALPPLLVPLIILFGVIGGVFTATESAAIAVCLSLLLSVVVYKSVRLRDLGAIFSDSAVTSCISLFMMAVAGCVAWLVGYLNLPELITSYILSITSSYYGVMTMLILVLSILGMLLNPSIIIIAFMPVILALGKVAEAHPLHLGIIVNLVLSLAVITPPYGTSLLLAAQIGGVSPLRAFVSIIPMFLLAMLIIFLGVVFPELFLFIPRFFMPNAM